MAYLLYRYRDCLTVVSAARVSHVGSERARRRRSTAGGEREGDQRNEKAKYQIYWYRDYPSHCFCGWTSHVNDRRDTPSLGMVMWRQETEGRGG